MRGGSIQQVMPVRESERKDSYGPLEDVHPSL